MGKEDMEWLKLFHLQSGEALQVSIPSLSVLSL